MLETEWIELAFWHVISFFELVKIFLRQPAFEYLCNSMHNYWWFHTICQNIYQHTTVLQFGPAKPGLQFADSYVAWLLRPSNLMICYSKSVSILDLINKCFHLKISSLIGSKWRKTQRGWKLYLLFSQFMLQVRISRTSPGLLSPWFRQ